MAPDPERRVKHGEFVYYLAQVDGEERQIIARVTGRESVKLFLDNNASGTQDVPEIPMAERAAQA